MSRSLLISSLIPFVASGHWMGRCAEWLTGYRTRPFDDALQTNLARYLPDLAPFVLPPFRQSEIATRFGLSHRNVLFALSRYAERYARPAISGYRIGTAGLFSSGNIVMGVNLEFPGARVGNGVHAEQFLVALAILRGEKGLVQLALPAPPCGMCRQWLNELPKDIDPRVSIYGAWRDSSLSRLLPRAFGPSQLGKAAALTTSPRIALDPLGTSDLLMEKAHEAASRSYAPYSQSFSGVALDLGNDRVLVGFALENAALNPTMPPLQVALVGLVAEHFSYDVIRGVALFESLRNESSASYRSATQSLLTQIAPNAYFRYQRVVRGRYQKDY